MIKTRVEQFINGMKTKYPQYSYDYVKHDNGEYEIMHNYENEDNDEQFSDFAFDLFKQIFIDNKIFNVGFCYDYDFAMKISEKTGKIFYYSFSQNAAPPYNLVMDCFKGSADTNHYDPFEGLEVPNRRIFIGGASYGK